MSNKDLDLDDDKYTCDTDAEGNLTVVFTDLEPSTNYEFQYRLWPTDQPELELIFEKDERTLN